MEGITKIKPWYAPIAHFATHTMVNSTVFVIIALPAAGLSALIVLLARLNVSTFVMRVFTFLEYAILLADAALFVVWLLSDMLKFVKEIRQ